MIPSSYVNNRIVAGIITIVAVLVAPAIEAPAITITVGGSVEETSVRLDQMTADVCSYIYNCPVFRMVSLQGRWWWGSIQPGTFDPSPLKAAYANTATKADYATHTENASWAVTGHSDRTAYNSAFSATKVYDPIADKSYHSQKAMGGETAPGADESLVALYSTRTIGKLIRYDYYAYSDHASGATVTNNAFKYTGGDLFDRADRAQEWTIDTNASY